MDSETIQRLKQLMLEARLLLDELDESPTPPPTEPANVVPIRPDEVELEGVIGRPEVKEVRGKALFTAGLKVTDGEGERWLSIAAWGKAAESASTIRRGQIVKVVGTSKQVRFIDGNGVMRDKQELTATLISPLVVSETLVGSAVNQ